MNLTKYHGKWKSRFMGFVNGFSVNDSVGLEDVDSWIIIDASNPPRLKISTVKGTLWHIHPAPSALPSDTFYEEVEEGILMSNEFIQHGPDFSIGECFFPVLKYIPPDAVNPPSLIVTCDAGTLGEGIPTRHPSFSLLTGGPLYLDKISDDIAPSKQMTKVQLQNRNVFTKNWGGSQEEELEEDTYGILRLFEYIFHRLYTFIATTPDSNQDIDQRYSIAKNKYQQYLTWPYGRQFTTPITEIWKTRRNSGVTEVFTKSFHFATAGSTIAFERLPEPWHQYNNRWMTNAVSTLHFADVPVLSPLHVDVENRQTKIVWCEDTADMEHDLSFKDDQNNGNHKFTSAGAVLRVKHVVHPNMQYPEFIAAVLAMQYDIFRVSQHTAYSAWCSQQDGCVNHILPQSWEELKHILFANRAAPVHFRWRVNRIYPSSFYNNPVDAGQLRSLSSAQNLLLNPNAIPTIHINDPFIPVEELKPGGYLDYNIVLNNYVKQPLQAYWRMTGRNDLPFHAMLPHLGYTSSGSEFELAIFPLASVHTSTKTSLRSSSWTLLGSKLSDQTGRDVDICSRNNFYWGHILQNRSSGGEKVCGYMRIASFELSDPLLLMHDTRINTKDVITSPRFGSENFCKLFAPIMRSLIRPGGPQTAPVNKIILDLRGNHGGLGLSFIISSFFGDDRIGVDGQLAIPNPVNSLQIGSPVTEPSLWTEELQKRRTGSYMHTLEASDQIQSRVYVRENIKRYGSDCVFQNGTVILLIDEAASSEGDEIAHWFLGDRFDRNIGANTHVILVGEIDGRIRGGTFMDFTSKGLPVLTNALLNHKGEAVCPIPVSRIENGSAGLLSMQNHKLSIQDNRTAIAPHLLPNHMEVVWTDIGLLSPSVSDSNGTRFNDRSTWKDSWLEYALNL